MRTNTYQVIKDLSDVELKVCYGEIKEGELPKYSRIRKAQEIYTWKIKM